MNIEDRILGTIYGQAIGDALGLPVEHRTREQVERFATEQPSTGWPNSYIGTVRKDCSWKPGEWSDDTDQAICILQAYLKGVDEGKSSAELIDQRLLAKEFLEWAALKGRGIGGHTRKVFENPKFLTDPVTASHEIWLASGRQVAPNGAVMRTSYAGILRPWDLGWTMLNSAWAASTTHRDPRCVASAVAVSVAVAVLVSGASIQEAVSKAEEHAGVFYLDIKEWLSVGNLEELRLDEILDGKPSFGYTFKCLGAAFWALREFQRREKEEYDDLWPDRFQEI